MKSIKVMSLFAALLLTLLLAACGGAADPTPTAVAPTEQPTDQPGDEEEDHEAEADEDHADDDHEHEEEEAAHEEDADHDHEHEEDADHEHDEELLALPHPEAVALDGRLLNVVASTSIIGDVVGQVGGEAIQLVSLIQAGQDPHSYEATAQDLTAVANADVIFVNGWDLEEALAHDLEEVAQAGLVVPISAGIVPLDFDDDEHDHDEETDADHDHEEGEEGHHHTVDPHVWWDIDNVKQWVENAEHLLSDLDPANAELYEANAAAYLAELDQLAAYIEAELGQIPAEKRFLITNHESFNYFANKYNFMVLGSVIPSFSALAEPSANDLANLVNEMKEHQVCAIFTEFSLSDSLANTLAGELNSCAEVKVVSLYSDALGEADTAHSSYIEAFRANVDAIVAALR